MTLRFSQKGPVFPTQLVEALIAGDVVFLCGAGVSAPQLPGFGGLVETCFSALNIEMNASETLAFKESRYEEALGSLGRRIVDPTLMTQTVATLLQPPTNADLNNHHTILRLSRNIENKPTVVTTNFDTLFERALLEKSIVESRRSYSFAGQDLPAPGGLGFGGIIHLHGRIGDDETDLDGTALVLTSADYGDAYMRSGWASRFLFDLCRSKTIVLVGYSAGDAPFRYFLNVLEADRERFPDLRPVYAMDAVDDQDGDDVRWSTLAVEPLRYEYIEDPKTGRKSHSAMWQDLEKLAELIERPRSTRRVWIEEILAKPFDEVSDAELDRVRWLLGDGRDLWPIVARVAANAEWFDFFAQEDLWTDLVATWVVAAWLGRDLQSTKNFDTAITWLRRLGNQFSDEIARRIPQAGALSRHWLKAWRILSLSVGESGSDPDMAIYRAEADLRSEMVFNSDVRRSVGLITPELTIEPNSSHLYGEAVPEIPARLSDIAWWRLSVADRGASRDLLNALIDLPDSILTISMASQALRSVVELAVDAELIEGDDDSISASVPSVEPHEQNQYRDGPIFLLELISTLLPAATKVDRMVVRGLAESWRRLPGALGQRLWLHALRDPAIFSTAEVMAGLAEVPRDVFWTADREIGLLLQDRAGSATPKLVAEIEKRILTEGDQFYDQFEVGEGQADWRMHARDSAVWLRLQMLKRAGAISEKGQAELDLILKRRDYLDREVEDHDFFGSYSYGVRTVVGDPLEIVEAPDEERLEVAQRSITSQDIDKREGWRAYCHAEPNGAFDTLKRASFEKANTRLWRDFINSLAWPSDEKDSGPRELIPGAFAFLDAAPNDFLSEIVGPLAALYRRTPRQELVESGVWWGRLFSVSTESEDELDDEKRDLYNSAINSPGGNLTEALLVDAQDARKVNKSLPAWILNAIGKAASANGLQGAMARAVLLRHISFVMSLEVSEAAASLVRHVSGNSVEAVALRAVLIGHGNITPKAFREFSDGIKLGLKEVDEVKVNSKAAAATILSPGISIILEEAGPEVWGIDLDEIGDIFRSGSSALRTGAADVLSQWVQQIEGGPEMTWRTAIGPLLARIWPRERALRDAGVSSHFAALAVGSGEAFPEAFEQLRPYLVRTGQSNSLISITRSKIPEAFPQETLTLLWCLFGPGHSGNRPGVPKILDRLVAVESEIEVDRRLQWLDQNAVHYD